MIHCVALYCVALNCVAVHGVALHCVAVHGVAVHFCKRMIIPLTTEVLEYMSAIYQLYLRFNVQEWVYLSLNRVPLFSQSAILPGVYVLHETQGLDRCCHHYPLLDFHGLESWVSKPSPSCPLLALTVLSITLSLLFLTFVSNIYIMYVTHTINLPYPTCNHLPYYLHRQVERFSFIRILRLLRILHMFKLTKESEYLGRT